MSISSPWRDKLWIWVFVSFLWLVLWVARVPSQDFGINEKDGSREQGPMYGAAQPMSRRNSAPNVIAIQAGADPTATISADGKVAGMKSVSGPRQQKTREDSSTILNVSAPSSFQWRFNGTTPPDHSKKSMPSVIQLWDTSWVSASKYEMIVNETINGHETLVQLRASNKGHIRSTNVVRRELRKKYNASLPVSSKTDVEMIYYINMDHRPVRRAIMESWLSKQPIPYQRVPGERGQEDSCVPRKQGRRCIGISGLARTNVKIMDKINTTGIIMVVEDDFVIRDMNKLLASVHLVPPDWDILRWDCWDNRLPHFKVYPFAFEVGVINAEVCKNVQRTKCNFCGGTHVSMWRGGESLEKLRRLWGTPPHDGIDCQLVHPSITSYCIQVGVGEFHIPLNEWSDIPKDKIVKR